MVSNKKLLKESGMSLIELMIALLIGLLLSAAIITVYMSNKKTFWDTEAAASLQENSRFAVKLITDDIRAAGFYADSYDNTVINNNVPAIVSGSCSDSEFDYDQPIWGAAAAAGISCLDGFHFKVGTDILFVKGSRMDPAISTSPPGSGNQKTYMIARDRFTAEHYMAEADLADKSYGNPAAYEYSHHAYFIAHKDGDAFPQLRRLSQRVADGGGSTIWIAETVADGIEDLRYMFGVDTDNDGAANQYIATENMASWDNIVSVKIFMLAQATTSDMSFSGGKTYEYGGRAAYKPTDRYHRKLYETTVTIRNIMTQ